MEASVSLQTASIKPLWDSLDGCVRGWPFFFRPNRWWTPSMRSRELILSYVPCACIGHMHGSPVRWPSLPAGNALSHRQMWQMNTQHDPGVFVIWCSLSNGFTADDPGQRRTERSTPKVNSRFLRGITETDPNPAAFRFHSINVNRILAAPLTSTPTESYPFCSWRSFLNLTKVAAIRSAGHTRLSPLLSLTAVQPSIYSAGTV